MSGLRRRRWANFALPMEQAAQAGEDLSPLAFRVELPDRPSVLVDLTESKVPRLARELAQAIRSMARVGRRIASPGAVQSYVQVARKMDAFFAGRVDEAVTWTVGQITPEDVNDFESWLYETLPTSRTAYALLTQAVTLLREIRDASPEALNSALHDRLMFVGLRPRPQQGTPVDSYPPKVAEALREACRRHIREAVRRLATEADAAVAMGEDPLTGGWGRRENVLWYLDRHGPISRPPRRGNRKGVVEKANHSAAQRWWRTVPDALSIEQAQSSVDKLAVRMDERRRSVDGVKVTVAELAEAEPLLVLPTLPFPAELEVVRTVSPQALVSFEGNLYSVPPGMGGMQVTVRHRLGKDYLHIVTAGRAVVARHELAPRGAGRKVRDAGHVIALERAVLAQVSDRAPCKTKTRRPLSPAALAEAERLRGLAAAAGSAERVVIDLDTYAAVADRLRTAPRTEEEPGE
ncbi:hypothetical protein PV755_45910 [Streptomyces caniscabiei]|uniref:Mu transposase domain-containing protein n=1 Tax=Streptomyces caniscabiei TaxID=2746961 RepID=UPI0029B5C5C2|nr:hypothetical protein [Streptomyces caniscabiei]MDX3516151.1 hypothetical protein [Streptomyces caniscabiei]